MPSGNAQHAFYQLLPGLMKRMPSRAIKSLCKGLRVSIKEKTD